jgi:hypothetical protein
MSCKTRIPGTTISCRQKRRRFRGRGTACPLQSVPTPFGSKMDASPSFTSNQSLPRAERDFLDRIAALSIIGKNVKQELEKCLERRNGCGHPNSRRLGQNTVAHHIEVLLLNVFEKF